MKNLVIIPTYNEKENILNILAAVLQLEMTFDILVVDDGSPDGTADLVKGVMRENQNRVFILERSGKLGLGTAYIAGFEWGIQKAYDFIFEMDADFSHNPKDLIRLAKALHDGTGDVAVGSRYVKGGAVENWPFDRLALSFGASLYVRMITWMMVKDPTAGFVGYSAKVLKSLDLSKIRFVGYAFQIEMKFASRSLGWKIVEVPITFIDRELGTSKMNSNIISEAVLGVIQMKWKSFFNSYAAPKNPVTPSNKQKLQSPS